ncbi:ergothioneine biosynthesis protein EgtB [Winogradskyella epiphytica]|uniref:Ergothioneine biosynthesis protein EgtB n=1 Tax=Winogradskyella epiphytica TaxID=262005 RepID=A0A2V4X9X1_9FLAO|nr:ergothioneine biosynthesis protein EgtB [Winogradskyella epiphytica]PYE82855.1 ergothioneine biosynthesis protein EgtB [Winogradskyella epiphytica]GGW54156.1 ergothioneine biosynthesis protein EgtB [Winogradskyella epiphytica]
MKFETTTKSRFLDVRHQTEQICKSLKPEDVSIQPAEFVSPPKWHLAHTTWFFEQFILSEFQQNYNVFNDDFAYYFNSYYNNVGERVLRAERGLMTRPSLQEVLDYRTYVNEKLSEFIAKGITEEVSDIIEIGLQHEQQHQELLIYDIKYIFGNQPSFPVLDYNIDWQAEKEVQKFIRIPEGIYEIGHQGDDFCFDNELSRHKVYLHDYEISNRLVTNSEYIAFIEAGGYEDFNLWHAEGWDFIQDNDIKAPLYWHKADGKWMQYTLNGFVEVVGDLPVSHISFFEAFAFAQWKGMRLPTEFEWEVASNQFNYGQLWEWTNSAYLPYPNYTKVDGALGEYNGKFMVNQMVLRGASVATAIGHSRSTYRNFFHANLRWHFCGIRLAK